MESRRYVLFIVAAMGTILFWSMFVAPMLMPKPKPKKNDPAKTEAKKTDGKETKDKTDGKKPGPGPVVKQREPLVAPRPKDPPVVVKKPDPKPKPKPIDGLPSNPEKSVMLGTLDTGTGYFLQVKIDSLGAVISEVKMNDPRFKDVKDTSEPLQLLGNNDTKSRTFQLTVEAVDKILKKQFDTSLDEQHWAIIKQTADEDNGKIANSVTLEYRARDLPFAIRKTYTLARLKKAVSGKEEAEARKSKYVPYTLRLDLELENTAGEEKEAEFTLTGPVGIKLENREVAREHRSVRFGVLNAEGEVDSRQLTAREVATLSANDELPSWDKKLHYIGIDVLYFAALVRPLAGTLEKPKDQNDERTVAKAEPFVVEKQDNNTWADVGVKIEGEPIDIDAGKTHVIRFELYAGPKRNMLLAEQPLRAEGVVSLGWFSFIGKLMLGILNSLNGYLGFPYWLAIIGLTCIVRGLMFPLSKKQTIASEKMKQLQPEILALKKKYGDNREAMARAQMELYRKHNFNPFSGCFPILLQLPIFIGLYNGLSYSIDLRLASFLWVENLAAPDRLFPLGFKLWPIGSYFNLLPILTIVLFIVQQKMFMPPPTTPQAKSQQKIFTFMMIFMGFLFYRVPAGLCLYFIASSLWGVAERKFLEKYKSKEEPVAQEQQASNPHGSYGQPRRRKQRQGGKRR